jgi:hypothetical protein
MKALAALFVFCVLIIACGGTALAADDELCSQMAAFRTASFDKDAQAKPLRRSVEFQWIGNWLDLDKGWKVGCNPGNSLAGKRFCAYLLADHVNTEFEDDLPASILACAGWKIPSPWSGLHFERMQIAIHTGADGTAFEGDRYLLLETDMRPRKTRHAAIRLSAIPYDEKYLDPEPVLKIDDPQNPPSN